MPTNKSELKLPDIGPQTKRLETYSTLIPKSRDQVKSVTSL